MGMLLELVRKAGREGGEIKEVRICKINSGKFGVKWERTAEVLEGMQTEVEVEVWDVDE
jgi:ADP-ribose 1''-phosphate phosphatase